MDRYLHTTKKHNIKALKKLIYLFGMFFSLWCCTYSPEEKFFEEIERKNPLSTILLENFNDTDTIFLFESTSFQFSVSAADVNITETEVLLGTTSLLKTNGTNGTFFILENVQKSGTYELKIQITTNSGTGSLADKYGTELVQTWRKWILVFDVDIPVAPTLLAIEENGFLKITWSKYVKRNFKSYKIYLNFSEWFTITDSNQNFFIDSTFIGPATITFTVAVNTNLHSSTSNAVVINELQSVQFSYSPVDSTAVLKWRKTRFSNAFKKAVISENDIVRKTIDDPNDTTVSIRLNEAFFGSNPVVSLKIFPKYGHGEFESFSFQKFIDNPLDLPKIGSNQYFFYNSTMEILMGHSSSDNYLRSYNSNMRVVDSVRVSSFSMPYPGNFIYRSESGGIGQYNFVTKELKIIPVTGYYSASINRLYFSGANNGLLLYSFIDSTYPWDAREVTRLVDFNSGEIRILQNVGYDPRNNVYRWSLSDDGIFVRSGNQIYEINNMEITNYSYISSTYDFRPENSAEMISKATPSDIIKTSDGSLIRTISPPESGYVFVNYDIATKHQVYFNRSLKKVYLINIETLETKTINAASIYRVMNGIMFDNLGHYLNVL